MGKKIAFHAKSQSKQLKTLRIYKCELIIPKFQKSLNFSEKFFSKFFYFEINFKKTSRNFLTT